MDPYLFERKYLPALSDMTVVRNQIEEIPGHLSFWIAVEAHVETLLNREKGKFYHERKRPTKNEEGEWQKTPSDKAIDYAMYSDDDIAKLEEACSRVKGFVNALTTRSYKLDTLYNKEPY